MTDIADDPTNPDVVVRRHGRLGHLVLNRPNAMNALTLGMVVAIRQALDIWSSDPAVEGVLISGAGERGLCAGGDVVSVRRAAQTDGPAAASRFFTAEYDMNLAIAEYPKPVIAIMDGVVLGGGVGVSAHGSVRVVTERSRVGMPETGIGFFPDVGGTYLLSHAPGETGTHLALTGSMVDGADAIMVGLADVYVPSSDLDSLTDALGGPAWATAVAQRAVQPPASSLLAARTWIDDGYAADSVEEILERLRSRPEPQAQAAVATILTRSPTSLKVTLKALRQARTLPGLGAALEQEEVLARRFTEGHDFSEGVRAQLVDKDRTPHWRPARIEDVTDDLVDAYFR